MKNIAILGLLGLFLLPQDTTRKLPARGRCRALVSIQRWARGLEQIPSVVIDKGVMRHVPYTSYAVENYELNVYGDPVDPCSIEIGIYEELTESDEAKKNCLEIMATILDNEKDAKFLASLDKAGDTQVRDGLTFEITPPTAEDAFEGWWISVYNEPALDRSRASEEELKKITTTTQQVEETEKKETKSQFEVQSVTKNRWAGDDLKKTRRAEKKQAVYKPTFSRRNGVYVPDRSEEDTGYILFVCANSDKHEDREELLKDCHACGKQSTFFWDRDQGGFVCFKCGEPYPSGKIQCTICGKAPKRVRTRRR